MTVIHRSSQHEYLQRQTEVKYDDQFVYVSWTMYLVKITIPNFINVGPHLTHNVMAQFLGEMPFKRFALLG